VNGITWSPAYRQQKLWAYCRKQRYLDAPSAFAAMARPHYGASRVYRCQICDYWHLTTSL